MNDHEHIRVLHPTDLSEGSVSAFAHGLLFATKARGHFTVLHVDGDERTHWSDMPGVRDMLSRWDLINGPDDMEGLNALGLGVKKVIAMGDDPVETTIDHLEGHATDLVVMGTHQDQGWRRWTRKQVAEPIARASKVMSLFVPSHARGFVDMDTGKARLKKVLVPIAVSPHARAAVTAVGKLARSIGSAEVECTLLHVGEEGNGPILNVSDEKVCKVVYETMQGDVVEKILERATALDVDLVAMTTKGHDGFLDMLRGSRTERVLRQTKVAVLAIPEA